MPNADGMFLTPGREVVAGPESQIVIDAVAVQSKDVFEERFGLALDPGLWHAPRDIIWAETFAVGHSICVTWVFRGTHVGSPLAVAGGPPPRHPNLGGQPVPLGDPDPSTEPDPTGASIRTNGRGLGFTATRRPVHVKVLSTGLATIENGVLMKAELGECRWDSVSVLGQLGVQAVGRPVLSTPVLPLP